MNSTNETIEILNDLIEINNDRVTGYEKAIKELKGEDADLKALFINYIGQSHKIKLALGTEIQALGGDIEQGTTTSGKIYRAWMDVKAAFTGHSTHTVLENAEFGEDAAQKAYQKALESEDLSANLKSIITAQKQELKKAHDEIKALRDAQPA